MGFNHFRLGVLFRVITLALTIFIGVYLFYTMESSMSVFIVGGFLLAELIELFRYIEITNKKLTRFLESIRFSDFSTGFSHDNKLGNSFKELNKSFTSVLDAFRQARAEKEEHLNYLNTIVQHVTTGLLSFDEEGNVGLVNQTAKRFLKTPQMHNIGEIAEHHAPLYKKLLNLKPGEKILYRLASDTHLAIHSVEIKLRGRNYKLVAFQNIHAELQSKEVEAWQNLTRVLRHEIMNSITPIASLTGTLNEILNEDISEVEGHQYQMPADSIQDLREGLNTIENRSHGLIRFVDAYRDYTSIPKPKFTIVKVAELFEHIEQLLSAEFRSMGILFTTRIDREDLKITADRELIEMVLINLLKNSREALSEREGSKIELSAQTDAEGRLLLEVKDNGPGIIKEAQEQIFIPFYTTKRGGSGIGLALSRQIMQLHNGELTVKSEPEIYTIFTLRF